MRADEVASLLGVPRDRVYELRYAGRLPAIQLGRNVRFDPRAVAMFIKQGIADPRDA